MNRLVLPGRLAGALMVAGSLLAILPIPAGAATLSVNGSTVFFDNFESGDLNNPTGGFWLPTGGGVSVTNAASPGPAEGSFYAQLFRDGGACFTCGNLDASLNSVITSGDVLLRLMVYIPSTADQDARGQFFLDNGDFGSARAWARPNGAGFVEVVGPAFAVTTTAIPYATNTWQEWDLEYVIGASTFSVSVNGVSQSGFASFTTGQISRIEINNGVSATAGSLFIDAIPTQASGVPEPATCCLVGTALFGAGILRFRFQAPLRRR